MANSKSKGNRAFTVWVKLDAIVGFKVIASNLDEALRIGQEEVRKKRLVSEDVEYMDGKENISGIMEDD